MQVSNFKFHQNLSALPQSLHSGQYINDLLHRVKVYFQSSVLMTCKQVHPEKACAHPANAHFEKNEGKIENINMFCPYKIMMRNQRCSSRGLAKM